MSVLDSFCEHAPSTADIGQEERLGGFSVSFRQYDERLQEEVGGISVSRFARPRLGSSDAPEY